MLIINALFLPHVLAQFASTCLQISLITHFFPKDNDFEKERAGKEREMEREARKGKSRKHDRRRVFL